MIVLRLLASIEVTIENQLISLNIFTVKILKLKYKKMIKIGKLYCECNIYYKPSVCLNLKMF